METPTTPSTLLSHYADVIDLESKYRRHLIGTELGAASEHSKALVPLEYLRNETVSVEEIIQQFVAQPKWKVGELILPKLQLDNPFNSDESSQSEEPETPDSALASSNPRAGHAFLPFMDLDLWIPNIPYDENPPLYIRYTVQWKFTVNNRATAKDTRQDLAISPSDFWEADLQETIDKLIERNRRTHPSAHVYETSLTVSVNERSELDLTKRADELNIEWGEIERQLRRWSPLLRQGKRLVLQLVFKLSNKNGTDVGKRGRKRGRRSATDIMLTERASHLDAEDISRTP
ncbi:hypothetical protein KJ359_010179, partial [Pestalotiopsis sp. 9143b]